eukprot:2474857-Ditylum_brightwellii.AAC.1
MRFLRTVKNSQHEVDMAFVRHSQDRKLDLPRFHSILSDIAVIQYPSLKTKEAVAKVLWDTVVMLPPVNEMAWKESKRMAIRKEAKR